MSTTFEIWPAERSDIVLMVTEPVPEGRSDNSVRQVVELLAAVEGVSVDQYLAVTTPDLPAVRELSRYSHEAILAAALVAPDLRPVTVLGVLSTSHARGAIAS